MANRISWNSKRHSPFSAPGNRNQRNALQETSNESSTSSNTTRLKNTTQKTSFSKPNGEHSGVPVKKYFKDRPKFNKFGYRKLEDLVLNQSENEAVVFITNNFNDFSEFLKSKPRWDLLVLLLKLLSKILKSEFSQGKLKIFSSLCNNDFIEYLTVSVSSTITSKRNNIKEFYEFLLDMFEGLMLLLSYTAAERLTGLIQLTSLLIEQIDELKLLHERASSLKGKLEEVVTKKHENQKQTDRKHNYEPPNDYRSISIYPTKEDFLERNFLRPNIVEGSYENVEHYLDIQFRLLREDYIRPLKMGLETYRENKNKKKGNRVRNPYVKVYNNVQFSKLNVDIKHGSRGILYEVKLDEKTKKIRWAFSKRLLYGSLLLFSKDDFSTFIIATVSDRSVEKLGKEGVFQVTLVEDIVNKSVDFESVYTLIESSAFFDPYFNVLSTMQKLPTDSLPMENYILVKDNSPHIPGYLLNKMILIPGHLGREFNVNFPLPVWPTAEELALNDSQLNAFKASFENEFVVIQGPPGTGKTFLALKIVKTMLKNFDVLNVQSPIVIVCYTNHALDQFLENLIDTTQDIIRIGGQSKNENLDQFNLNKFRKMRSDSYFEAKNFLQSALEHVQTASCLIDAVRENKGVLNIPFYIKKNKELQTLFDMSSEDFVNWLFQEFFECSYIQFGDYIKLANKCGVLDDVLDNTKNMDSDFDSDDENYLRQKSNDEFLFSDFQLTSQKIHYFVNLSTLSSIKANLQEQIEVSKGKNLVHIQNQLSDFEEFEKYLFFRLTNKPLSVSNATELLRRNVWSLNYDDRWKLYFILKNKVQKTFSEELSYCLTIYSRAMLNFEEEQCKLNYTVLERSSPKILGLTTTGAAKNHTLLELLKPKIVVVEEAAEVLEAHVITSLTKYCRHLILIGDHEQLRPNPSCLSLAKKFKLDISLFERMLMNGMNCYQLNVQHRMNEDIASLITPTIYKDLKNHPSVLEYPNIRGVSKNLFFVDHKIFETESPDNDSHCNPHEANFTMALCRYLLLQNYSPQEITVLTTYSAQQYFLRDLKSKNPIFKNVRVTVVDNYQGEENNIIIMSLVRSNENANIGFLKTRNRICVALSRAKHAMYIIGNMSNLCKNSEIWVNIKDSLEKVDGIGESLPLKCEIHQTITQVKEESDFNQVQEGGCSRLCERLMPCGHTCTRLCHVMDLEHVSLKCPQPCQRQICPEQHPCPLLCYKECQPCFVKVSKNLPCGHDVNDCCYKKPEDINCLTLVKDKKPDCHHDLERFCFQSIDKVACPVDCVVRLDCGHACTQKCHVNNDPDHLKYECLKDCARKNLNCSLNHQCQKRCYEECGACVVQVKKRLPCDHVVEMDCSKDINEVICPRRCNKILPCNHPCRRDCVEPCGGCKVKVNKTFEECGHVIKNIVCSKPLSSELCRSPCERKLPCGHQCKLKCGSDCSISKCRELVPCPVKQSCGHEAKILCFMSQDKNFIDPNSDLLLKNCQAPCSQLLPCGDICQGTCGSCMQGRIHQACQQPCKNTLICGHACQVPCRENCPPCRQKCRYRCQHSICKKNCGVPCIPCKEPCDWKCPHLKCTKLCGDLCDREPCYEPCEKKLPCGHPCVGFCGEPCPNLCRICNNEELTEILFGEEEEPDARFVMLTDCSHVLESNGLEAWLGMENDAGKPTEIVLKCCPKCKTPIIMTKRFLNQTKITFQQIEAVKTKIFGICNLKKLFTEVKPLANAAVDMLMTMNKREDSDNSSNNLMSSLLRVAEVKGKLSVHDLQLIHFQAAFIKTIIQDYKKVVSVDSLYREKVDQRFNLLLSCLSKRDFKISASEMNQFNNEFLRFSRMVELALILKKCLSLASVQQTQVDKITRELYSTSPYSSSKDDIISRDLTALKEIVRGPFYQPVTEQERKEIHKAMSVNFLSMNKTGHWFTCSNGHYYVITECGGAMQKGVCPECKEVIGGNNHTLVGSSRLASDIDGAAHPAWSNAQNMANYMF